jgi:hypothetical protein
MKFLVSCGLITLGLGLAMTAFPASAGGKFPVPKGCTAYVTVQHSDCQVSHHYTCEADIKGDQWSVYAGAEGPYYMSRIDKETRWLESIDLIDQSVDHIATEIDEASFSTLLATGRDDFDFYTLNNAAEARHYVGFDRLVGETVTIDGITLERTEFEITAYDPERNFLSRRKGKQLISRDWRIFFADREEFENAQGDHQTSSDTPITFAQPGEPGFLETKPQFGCDQMMTDAGGLLRATFSSGGAR